MNIKFCQKHHQQLHRALTTRSLSEFGWRTDSERIEAVNEQVAGHYSRKNFNPFIQASMEICIFAGDALGNDANGCPICLLDDEGLIDRTAEKMAEIVQSLPDE